MAENIKVIADKIEIDDIAEAVREKTGKTEKMSLGAIARNIRGMSETGSGTTKTTKTIYLDWSGDEERICEISYISNNELLTIQTYDGIDSIEAEGGVIILNDGNAGASSYTPNFIRLQYYGGNITVLFAKQDGETIYLVSGGAQQ